MAAAAGRHWSVVLALARSKQLQNADAVNRDGETALSLAVRGQHCPAVTALICAGANVDCKVDNLPSLRQVVMRGRTDMAALLLAAGADATSVSASDCRSDEMRTLMLAAGVSWTDQELQQAIGAHWWQDDNRLVVAQAAIQSQVPAAKKRIELAGFKAIRERVVEICVALQDLRVPAPQLIEIVTHACAPFAAQLPYHYLWDTVVLVKHFHDRHPASD